MCGLGHHVCYCSYENLDIGLLIFNEHVQNEKRRLDYVVASLITSDDVQ